MTAGNGAWGIILAAGVSRRMAGVDKLFAPLAGRPLLYYGAALFERCPDVAGVIVVAAAEAEEEARRIMGGFNKFAGVARGGEKREDSARAGLAAVGRQAPSSAVVLIHDAARPLATEALVARLLAALARADGAVPAVALADTVKEIDERGEVTATPPRERLRAIQTPQAFRLGQIAKAYDRAVAEGREVTDDAAALEVAGGRVVTVEGERDNFKITYPEDFARAETVLAARDRPGTL